MMQSGRRISITIQMPAHVRHDIAAEDAAVAEAMAHFPKHSVTRIDYPESFSEWADRLDWGAIRDRIRKAAAKDGFRAPDGDFGVSFEPQREAATFSAWCHK